MKKESYISFFEFLKITRINKSPIFLIFALLFQIPVLNIFLLYLFFSFSYIFNDIIDIDKDKTRSDKILPKKSKKVINFLIVVNFLILIILFTVSYMISLKVLLLYVLATLFSLYYSHFLKNFFPSFAIQVWCFIAVFVSLYQSPHFSLVWLIFLYTLFYIREIPLDIRDVKDDSLNCVTLPLTKIFR